MPQAGTEGLGAGVQAISDGGGLDSSSFRKPASMCIGDGYGRSSGIRLGATERPWSPSGGPFPLEAEEPALGREARELGCCVADGAASRPWVAPVANSAGGTCSTPRFRGRRAGIVSRRCCGDGKGPLPPLLQGCDEVGGAVGDRGDARRYDPVEYLRCYSAESLGKCYRSAASASRTRNSRRPVLGSCTVCHCLRMSCPRRDGSLWSTSSGLPTLTGSR